MNSIQKNYLDYAISFAERNGIAVLLSGSLSVGLESNYSDIDLLMLEQRSEIIDSFIIGYRPLVYSAYTIRPKGICILIYDNGICVDLDIRFSITHDERKICKLLNNKYVETDDMVGRAESLRLNSIPLRTPAYQFARLYHRAMIKKLSGKSEESESLLEEIRNGIHNFIPQPLTWTLKFEDDIKQSFDALKKYNDISEKYSELVYCLISNC